MILSRFLTCYRAGPCSAACGGLRPSRMQSHPKYPATTRIVVVCAQQRSSKVSFRREIRWLSAVFPPPIGSYAKGLRRRGRQLPTRGQPGKRCAVANRNWGHPEMIDYIQTALAQRQRATRFGKEIYGVISASARGGADAAPWPSHPPPRPQFTRWVWSGYMAWLPPKSPVCLAVASS